MKRMMTTTMRRCLTLKKRVQDRKQLQNVERNAGR
jgi:hypothetical protein